MATLLPEGRRLLGLWPGVPVLLGSLSWLGQSLPPGWLSRGHIPCGRCQTLQPPGCSSVPSRGWGPDQPRHEGPLRPQPHGAGTGLGQRPCRCPPVSARSLCTGHTPPSPAALPLLRALLPPQSRPPCPFVLCPCPARGIQGSSSCPCPSPAVPPCCCCPSVPGGLSVQNRLLQPPRPGVNWGVRRGGTPDGHRGVTAAPLLPGTPQHPQD